MSKNKIRLQPIAVRSPLPQGTNIPALPLPQQELIGRNTSEVEESIDTGTTGITTNADASPPDADTGNTGSQLAEKVSGKRSRVRIVFPELPSYIEGKTRSVWKFLAEKADFDHQENGKSLLVKATRREIAKGAGIGSLDTVDRSLSRLQGLGFIDIERTRGVNDGSVIRIRSPEQHPASQEKAWDEIANMLEQSADLIKKKGCNLSPNQLIRWSQLADRAFRLVNSSKDRG